MRVIGYHCNNGIIANSDGEVCTEKPFIDFLLRPKMSSIKIFYNLGQNVSALCKMCNFTQSEVKMLHESNAGKINLPPYKMRYVKDRFLNLQKGYYTTAPYCYIYDANQYEETPVAENESVEQCIAKAQEASRIGEEILQTFLSLGINTDRLISPIRALEDKVLSKLSLPKFEDVPDMAGYYAYECCVGNWLEAYRMGQWDKVYDYDISSAYPAKLRNLMDLRFGKWIQSDKYVSDAVYGYCFGEVNMRAKFHPIMFRIGTRNEMPMNYTATGRKDIHLNKTLIDYIYRREMGTYSIKDGWWWIPNDNIKVFPFRQTIDWLHFEKEKSPEGLRKATIKRMGAGIWGKLLEGHGDNFGEMFNSVYGCEVETGVRIDICDFVIDNELNPIHINTDGVVVDKEVELIGNGIGSWKLSNVSPCICAGTGVITLREKKEGKFNLIYDELLEKIKENPEAQEYEFENMMPVTIAEAISGNWEGLGKLKNLALKVGISDWDKRYYKDKPKKGGELLGKIYQSEPWDISMIGSEK